MTLQAALERAALPESKRRPAFLYIDEAADYFDRNIDDLLTQARKYQLGVVFSHQYLDQLARDAQKLLLEFGIVSRRCRSASTSSRAC